MSLSNNSTVYSNNTVNEKKKQMENSILFSDTRKTFDYEIYLQCVMKKHRNALTKLRLSSHKLPIEKMRYQNVASDKRLCTIGPGGEVGDEIQFLTECSHPKMLESRQNFFEKARVHHGYQTKISTISHLS